MRTQDAVSISKRKHVSHNKQKISKFQMAAVSRIFICLLRGNTTNKSALYKRKKLQQQQQQQQQFFPHSITDNDTGGRCLQKLKSCYLRCIKKFFGYSKFYSVTLKILMLLDLRLPSFDTLIHNYRGAFSQQWLTCANSIICHFNRLQLVPAAQ